MCVYPLSPESPSHCTPLSHHRVTSWCPSSIHQLPTSYIFTHSSIYMSVLLSQFIPPSPSFPYACVSTCPFNILALLCSWVHHILHICIWWVYPWVEYTYRSDLRVLISKDLRVQSQRKAMPKNAQTIAQLHSSHTLVKYCSKFSKPGFNSMWTLNFQMFKLHLEKAEEPEIKLSKSGGSSKKQEFQKNIYFCFIDYAKAFDCVDHHKL